MIEEDTPVQVIKPVLDGVDEVALLSQTLFIALDYTMDTFTESNPPTPRSIMLMTRKRRELAQMADQEARKGQRLRILRSR